MFSHFFTDDVTDWVKKNTSKNSIFCSHPHLIWNPGVVFAGRNGFLGNGQAMQFVKYDNKDYRNHLFQWFTNTSEMIEFDYYLVDKDRGLDFSLKLTQLPLAYDNPRFSVYGPLRKSMNPPV